jgi:hypothetical protein
MVARQRGGAPPAVTTAVLSVGAAGAVVATALWLVHFGRGADAEAWHRLSDVGQAFGVVSAAISAAALAAVALSLRLQRRQADVAQIEAVFALRTHLLQYAVDRPDYLGTWGYDVGTGTTRAQRLAYSSMVIAYFRMAHSLGILTESELAFTCREMFRDELVAEFWAMARKAYLGDPSASVRRFAAVIDREFVARVPQRAAIRRPVPARRRRDVRRRPAPASGTPS